MRKIRYIIGIAAFAFCSIVFAQESKTSSATQKLYGTDVDDFMSVTDFTNVEPENIFAFTNFQNNKLHLGAAKKFGSVYTGLFFDGWFNTYYSTSKTTEVGGTTYIGNSSRSGVTVLSPSSNFSSIFGADADNYLNWQSIAIVIDYPIQDMAFIIGINDKVGIKLNCKCLDSGSADFKLTDGTNTVEESWKRKDITIGLEAGTKLNKESFVLMPRFALEWTGFFHNHEITTTTPTLTVTEKELQGKYNRLGFLAGFGMETKKEDLTHVLDFALGGKFYIYGKLLSSIEYSDPLTPSEETTQDHTKFSLNLTPSYKLQFDPEERFSIALKAALPFEYERETRGAKFVNNVQQNYESSHVDFSLSPDLSIAARWFAIPDKLTVNLGASTNFGDLLSYTYDAEAHTNAKNTWKFFDGGMNFDVSTGVSFDFAKGITLDTFYDIVSGNSGSQGSSFETVWDANMIFQLSVKL